jgi:hypothetical protein
VIIWLSFFIFHFEYALVFVDEPEVVVHGVHGMILADIKVKIDAIANIAISSFLVLKLIGILLLAIDSVRSRITLALISGFNNCAFVFGSDFFVVVFYSGSFVFINVLPNACGRLRLLKSRFIKTTHCSQRADILVSIFIF